MAKVEITLNSAGVKELLKSEEIKAVCKEYADRAVQKLGDGYSANTYDGKTRVNAEVVADSRQARAENAKSNTILKAVLSK